MDEPERAHEPEGTETAERKDAPEADEAPEAGAAADAPGGPDAWRGTEEPQGAEPGDRPEERVPVPGPRRRGRTALLVGTAAVLGLVAGTCTGYLVQADREPTRLPSLSQPVLPRAEGPAPAPLPAAQDRRIRTDGDLFELLLERPRGARESEWLGGEGWMDLVEYASTYESPADAFGHSADLEFRRAAITAWEQGDRLVEIRLVQYRQEEQLGARDDVDNLLYWTDEERHNDSWPLPGTGDGVGRAYTGTRPVTQPGFEPYYEAKAFAWRGDIAMHLWIADSEAIPRKAIMDLAERQLERL
ncbi:hypothetical protein [Streptomyces poriticola]|uniref:hypothetical protein n=1 Tax=Streptomyces poriticola TaxID=3120506 RepID=UPI002FCDEE81